MTYKEFIDYYTKYNKTPGMMSIPKHSLNEKELKSRYEKYCKVHNFNFLIEEDAKWLALVDKLRIRDYNICRLLKILTKEEVDYMKQTYPLKLLSTLDSAHVIPRSKSKTLYYELDNLVLLNRVSHSFLDSYRHPVYGTPITLEERKNWWIKIIGLDLYKSLENRQ
jgi:hypothetical protein